MEIEPQIQEKPEPKIESFSDISFAVHELRRPLQNIKTLTETLNMGAGEEKELREKFLGNILDEVERMSKLVTDMLRLGSLQEGNVSLKKSKIKLKELTEKILGSFKSKASRKSLSLENFIDENLLIEADEELLEHLIENLIENAIKYNTENGSVLLESENGNSFHVKDSGIGIDAGNQNKIFEQFFREAKNAETGSGIGLSIVKNIADLHGWKLEIESGKDHGTSIKVIF